MFTPKIHGVSSSVITTILKGMEEALVKAGVPVKDVHVVETYLHYGLYLEFIVTLIRIKGEPTRRLTARSVTFDMWDRKFMSTGQELIRDLVAAYRNSPLMAPIETPPCKGPNCGCTDGLKHSPECHAEHNAQ